MSTAFLLLALLVGSTPILLFWETPTATGVVAAVLAVALAIVVRGAHPGEWAHVRDRIRPIAIIAVIPCLWLFIQLLPLGPIGLSHQIWSSAQAALGQPTWGSITIDVGATIVALCRYLCAAGVLFLAATLGTDRRRAEWVLLILVAATAVIALTLAKDFVGLGLLKWWNGDASRVRAMDCATLGLVLTAGWTIRTFERWNARRARPYASAFSFALAAAAFVCCSLALMRGGAGSLLVAAGYGLATIIAFEIVRRFALGGWAWTGASAAALLVAVAIVTHHPQIVVGEPTLAFATGTAPALTAVTQRMLTDAPWAGTGAGTFAHLLPMYRDATEMLDATWAPTAAAGLEIELGRSMLAAIVATAAAAAAVLLRAGLRRGRDSFYCVAGAGGIVATLILGFTNAGVLGTANSIILAAALGLAVAQSKSRSVR